MKQRIFYILKSVSVCLLLLMCTHHSYAQTTSITGVVTDGATNLPLTGATIQVKGSSTGAIADIKGVYTIKAPKNAELIFSFLGYESKSVKVNGKARINVTLEEANILTEEVVVIGYGTARKSDVIASITSISADEIAAKAPTDIFDAIQGMSAGLQVTSSSGEPGADSEVRIRGISTFDSGGEPLYIVDGMPMDDISDINPGDISNFEIFKDAASASIYGSRAANGVIVITTKKGARGKPKIDIKYQGGLSWLSHLIPLTTPDDARSYERVRNKIYNEATPNPYTGGSRYTYSPVSLSDSLKYFLNSSGNIDDLVFRVAKKNQVDLSLSGSSDRINYFASAGLLNETGIVVNSSYKRLTSRLNVDYQATNRLKLKNSVSFSYSQQKGVDQSNLIQGLYDWLPYWAPINIEGDPQPVFGGKRSPYTVAIDRTRMTNNYKGSMLIEGEYKINKYLKITSRLSANFGLRRYIDYNPRSLTDSNSKTKGLDQSNLDYNYLNENFLNYQRKIKNHSMSFLLGMSVQEWRQEWIYLRGLDYSTDLIYTINAASELDLANTYTRIEEHSMMSYFGRGEYNYKSKYYVSGTLRYDGSSRFGSGNRWGLFPAVTTGWRLSEENFMKWAKPALSDAKLRVGFGITGNERIGNYDSWSRYFAGDPTTSSTTISNQQNGAYRGVTGVAPILLAYPDLGWEQTAQWNIGLDLSLLKNKLSIVFDVYDKETKDLLYNVQIPKETGYTTMRKNIGAMSNKGFEVTVNWKVIREKDWDWTVNFNYSRNDSKIKTLADGVPFYAGQNSAMYIYEGARLGEIWGYRHNGVYAYDESNAYDQSWNQLTPVYEGNTFIRHELNGTPYNGVVQRKVNSAGEPYLGGDINWLNGPNNTDEQKGMIDESDKVKLGCAQPDFYGGVNSTLRWKNLTLYANIYYSIGGDIFNYTRFIRNSFDTQVRTPEKSVLNNMWLNPGDVAIYPVPMPRKAHNSIAPSDYWIEDGSYVKLRSLRLTYNFPKVLIEKIPLRSAQIYVYGNNLLTFSKYKGFDPEIGGSSALAFGIDTGKYPRKIQLGFGVNIGF